MNHSIYDERVSSSTKGDDDMRLDAPCSILVLVVLLGLIMQRYLALPFSTKITSNQEKFIWATVSDDQVDFLTLFEMVNLMRWMQMMSTILIFASVPCLRMK